MMLIRKPYKSIEIANNVTISVGDEVKFTSVLGEVVEGCVSKLSAKSLEIIKEDAINSEVWAYETILEGSLQLN